jgi:membrane protein YdbS with pleckstrin-like domain
MTNHTQELTVWVYEGIWGVLSQWFRVPRDPPQLPAQEGEHIESFRPAVGFLKYLKLQFWIALLVVDVLILGGWFALLVASPVIGALLAIPALALAILPDVVVYVAIHLRYDTTWYVVSDRSLRIRRGIWIIHETTITFENVQNVSVQQGPLQRWFGIANVYIETAGGGGHSPKGQEGVGSMWSHQGLIEGIGNAPQIRDLLLSRVGHSRSAGLGDEGTAPSRTPELWTAAHCETLRDIRDALRQLA